MHSKDYQNNICFETFINNLSEHMILSSKLTEPGLPIRKQNIIVKKYDGLINYESGLTTHYKENRLFREKQLIQLLGRGKPVDTFLVDKEAANKDIEIQEILDNAIINVYSFSTHKKITLFAPPPERIIYLYEAVGEIPPEELVFKSEDNTRKGYNKIYCL
jgi:hypothetical protein